jgi:DNA-binding transcriptional MerR regulator
VTRAPTDRSHLSIGEVLSLLQDEFPDVTISKIRFLESQGLLDPERTPSGYRKFYDADIDRLRWILRQQKDHYLPLKVIKDRLDEVGPVRTAPTDASPADAGPAGGSAPEGPEAPAAGGGRSSGVVTRRNGLSAVALDERPAAGAAPPDAPAPGPAARPVGASGTVAPGPAARAGEQRPAAPPSGFHDVADVIEGPAPRPAPAPPAADPTLRLSPTVPAAVEPPAPSARRRGAGRRADPQPGAVSLTLEELIQASGLSARAVRELEGFGLIEAHTVGDASYYDGDDLIIARTAAGFLEHGIEARHIRSYKVAVEREAGLFEQIVLPLLKQRNPDAKRRATQTVAELMRRGDDMRRVLLRRGLRDHIPPS